MGSAQPATAPGTSAPQPPLNPPASEIPQVDAAPRTGQLQVPEPTATQPPPSAGPPPTPGSTGPAPVPTAPTGASRRILWIALGCAGLLVFLGGVIIDRNRSDEATTAADGAVSGPSTGRGESSADGGTPDANAGRESRDVCELLPEAFAEDLAGIDLEVNEVPRGVFCSYTPADASGDSSDVVLHSRRSKSEWDCKYSHCESYPPLPDGELEWSESWNNPLTTEEPEQSESYLATAKVRWMVGDDRWELSYVVSWSRRNGVSELPRLDISSKRDKVVSQAEKIYQDIMADPGTWGAED